MCDVNLGIELALTSKEQLGFNKNTSDLNPYFCY